MHEIRWVTQTRTNQNSLKTLSLNGVVTSENTAYIQPKLVSEDKNISFFVD